MKIKHTFLICFLMLGMFSFDACTSTTNNEEELTEEEQEMIDKLLKEQAEKSDSMKQILMEDE